MSLGLSRDRDFSGWGNVSRDGRLSLSSTSAKLPAMPNKNKKTGNQREDKRADGGRQAQRAQQDQKFILKSDFKPKGDQPYAIDALMKGFAKGKKHQIVHGVTGSGKSVTGDTSVLIYNKGGSSQFSVKLMKIGQLVDDLMRKYDSDRDQGGTEVLYSVDVGNDYYIPSFNAESKEVELKPITAFVRHSSPKILYKIKTACGREATFTGDHNLFVLRNGKTILVETQNLRLSDYIPLPVNLEKLVQQQDLDFVELSNHIGGAAYVDACKLVKLCMEVYGRSKVYSKIGVKKTWHILNENERMRVGSFVDFSNEFPLLNSFDVSARSRLGKVDFPLKYPLSDEFLELLGVYLAEGCISSGCVLLSVRKKGYFLRVAESLSKLRFNYSVRRNEDIQVSSVVLANMLKNMCGNGSFNKHLPEFWANLSVRQLGLLLRGYFTGDGGVDGVSVTATTASKRLASELLYAFSRFGIWARCSKRFKRATNSKHPGNFYYCVVLSGQDSLEKFQSFVGFSIDRKRKSLSAILGKNFNTNVDIIPGAGDIFLSIRTGFGLLQRDLAKMVGLSRSMISFIESGKRNISRLACERLVNSLCEKFGHCKLFDELKSLLRLRWTAIANIEKINSEHSYVYDFSVKDNETFLAGEGGLFVHNTFVMADVIRQLQRPALVLSHNKTLAAQLCSEFQEFFPDNAVSYFVSYYDYYQPEAYMPATDTYIEKDAAINEEIDKFRHKATTNLLTRRDVLVVATVSCIYGLGSVEDYENLAQTVRVGDVIQRDVFLRHLADMQYTRSQMEFKQGMFHVLGDTVEVFPPDGDTVYRVEFFGDDVEKIVEADSFTGEVIHEMLEVTIFPTKHNVTTETKIKNAVGWIEKDLKERYDQLLKMGKMLEAERIKTRTEYDIEILLETGYCSGIENYVRYLHGDGSQPQAPNATPTTLMDYLPEDFVLFIDESHMTVPQIGAMYEGNLSRKNVLVEHGFRLPSAFDNRPLKFTEFEEFMKRNVYVSATPGKYEIGKVGGARGVGSDVIELVVRPTGLLDPEISVRSSKGQIENLLKEIGKRVKVKERVLITTLTKKSAEDLSEFLDDAGIAVRYLHSDIETVERIEILRDLRLGKFDVLVGINLLREGLDLPEVSLVAILDADKEGFLRSESALIQTIGRCSRNVNAFVIMYADRITKAMKGALDETARRRKKQIAYNKKHKITPETIKKAVKDIAMLAGARKGLKDSRRKINAKKIPHDELVRLVRSLEMQMDLASQNLEFEKAAMLRDLIEVLKGEI